MLRRHGLHQLVEKDQVQARHEQACHPRVHHHQLDAGVTAVSAGYRHMPKTVLSSTNRDPLTLDWRDQNV